MFPMPLSSTKSLSSTEIAFWSMSSSFSSISLFICRCSFYIRSNLPKRPEESSLDIACMGLCWWVCSCRPSGVGLCWLSFARTLGPFWSGVSLRCNMPLQVPWYFGWGGLFWQDRTLWGRSDWCSFKYFLTEARTPFDFKSLQVYI